MRKMIRSISISVLLGFFTVFIFITVLYECFMSINFWDNAHIGTLASAQLPPKVIADKYRIQVRQLLEEKDYIDALNMVEKLLVLQKEHSLTLSHEFHFKDIIEQLLEEKRYITLLKIMDKLLVLQKEHSLTLPHEFHYQYAQVAFSTGFFQTAVDAVKKYLAPAGEQGAFYKEALALLNKAEQAEQIIPFEPEMVMIPSGHFLERGVYSTNVDLFALSKYEVTFEEYDAFTDATGRERADDEGWGRGRRPVINITRKDAVAYTMWLSEQTGKSYRLPSEEEWEYAESAGWWLDDIDNRGESHDWNGTLPVGSFSANKWGLHDMDYNVSEWTQYSNCGGSWIEVPRPLTAGPLCEGYSSRRRYDFIGFRVARSF